MKASDKFLLYTIMTSKPPAASVERAQMRMLTENDAFVKLCFWNRIVYHLGNLKHN